MDGMPSNFRVSNAYNNKPLFYAEWNSGSVLEKLELSKLLSDRIM